MADVFKPLNPKPTLQPAAPPTDPKQQFEEAILAWAKERHEARFERDRLQRNFDHVRAQLDTAEERLRIALDAPMPSLPA